jgi:HlyD family secretion protein
VEQQRVYVIVRATDRSLGLGDEYRVEVRVIIDERADALLVPEGALFRNRDGWGAFRVDGGTAELVDVGTGLRNGRAREVVAGLAEGDRVILHPDASIEPGARVEALPGERR